VFGRHRLLKNVPGKFSINCGKGLKGGVVSHGRCVLVVPWAYTASYTGK
jgi:hypothetical protein